VQHQDSREMGIMLNEREAQYVKTLMKWDELRIRLGWLFMVILVLGGITIVVTALLSLPPLDDKTALRFTLPGFAIGLVLIVFALTGIQWIKQRHLVVSILKKLQQQTASEEDHSQI